MALDPLRLIKVEHLADIPQDLSRAHPDIFSDLGVHTRIASERSTAIHAMIKNYPNIKRVALCTARMLEVYKATPELREASILATTVPIHDLLGKLADNAHALYKADWDCLATEILNYSQFLNTAPASCAGINVVMATTYNFYGSRGAGKNMRIKLIQNLVRALSARTNSDHDVYFKWLTEYGEDV
ncbi:hypothetical protein OAP32_00590 [Crocinitomicaceae bacterium]|nr:hypothetical protein [Crocinitomicaceae bacterium]